MCNINFDWRDDDPDYVPGVHNFDATYKPDPMEVMSDQGFWDWVECKDLYK